jgi:arylsulfatase A-like enzyme
MHIWTHLQPKYEAMVAKYGIYGAGMQELDDNVGVMLKKLDDLGIADNTIVIFSSDKGAEVMTWPDGGATPFRGDKNTNWEGAYRVPFLIRWPGVIKPGTEVNGITAHEDWVPTLGAAAGVSDIKEQLLTGYKAGDSTYKVHLDGYNLMPYLKGETPDDPRREFLYWTDDGELACLRYDKWKLVFMEQRAHGLDVWDEPFWTLRAPKVIDLHSDPFERGPGRHGLQPLEAGPRISAAPCPGLRRAMAAILRAVPAATETGRFQSRAGDKKADDRGGKHRKLKLFLALLDRTGG